MRIALVTCICRICFAISMPLTLMWRRSIYLNRTRMLHMRTVLQLSQCDALLGERRYQQCDAEAQCSFHVVSTSVRQNKNLTESQLLDILYVSQTVRSITLS